MRLKLRTYNTGWHCIVLFVLYIIQQSVSRHSSHLGLNFAEVA